MRQICKMCGENPFRCPGGELGCCVRLQMELWGSGFGADPENRAVIHPAPKKGLGFRV